MRFIGAIAVLGSACVVYGIIEARLYRLRSYSVPVLPEGSATIRILQVSDLHMRAGMKKMERFLTSLGGRTYDLVLATGDLLGDAEAVATCTSALSGLKATIARFFVFGSSDYYAPKFKNYVHYFFKIRKPGTRKNRTEDFRQGLLDSGWTDLTNMTVEATVGGHPAQITGLDDPYLHREDRSLLVRMPGAALALCVVHDPAPYEQAARAGFDLVVAGHTHGGQVRFPFIGAVVTNSELPRRYARGLHPIGDSWLFVTPGLGTGRFAPFRFLCRPEASVLELVPAASEGRR